MYVYSENFILPLSHDEVVHGKGSLLGKMPGDEWQKFANLRLLFGCMYAQPGKKLLFMGGEFGQWREWNHDQSVDWHLLNYPPHAGIKHWVEDLNKFYRNQPALYQKDYDPAGFEWIDCNDVDNSAISFLRRGQSESDLLLFVCNFTPVTRYNYRVGAPKWEILG
jgi:1,4-alpha-glucan branching enzyme